jgi:hypothetical protein
VFADLRKRLRTLDRRSAWLLLAACTLAPTWHLFFRVQLLEAAIGGAPGGGVARDLLPAFASFAAALLLMAVIPLAAARLAWGEPPAAFGLQRGDLRFGVRAAVLTAPLFIVPTLLGAYLLPAMAMYWCSENPRVSTSLSTIW